MYNDARASQQAAGVKQQLSSSLPIANPTSSLPKLLWLREHFQISENHHALHQSEWLSGKLCQRFDTGDENNCLKLGYDPVRRAWTQGMENLNFPTSILPTVHPPGNVIAKVSANIVASTGLDCDCLIMTGTTDSTAAALATDILQTPAPGTAVTSLGSSMTFKTLSDSPLFDADLGIYSHRVGKYWLVGGASNSGGAVLKALFSDQEIEQFTQQLNPHQATGLDYYPLLKNGERFPHNDPEYPSRLTPVPDNRALYFQGILESMAAIEQHAYQLLEDLGAPKITKILTLGGGSKNEGWRQIREHLLNCPVFKAGQIQAAYGTALLARQGYWQKSQVKV